jgi:O-antigen/teichoic acid export membrane protein
MYAKVLLLCTALTLPAIKAAFPILIGEAYRSAEITIPLFLTVAAVSAISTFIGNIFYAIKETRMIFISMVISAVTNVLLCYPLIRQYHINGANLSVLISFTVNILVRCVVLKKRIGFRLEKGIAVMLLPLAISSAGFILLDWKLNCVVVAAVVVFALFYFRSYLKGFLTKLRSTLGG